MTQLQWHAFRRDAKGLAELQRALGEVELDLTDAAASTADYVSGIEDEASLASLELRVAHYDTIEAGVAKRGDKPTKAAAALLRASTLGDQAVMTRDASKARDAVAGYARARSHWDGFDTRDQAGALVELALLETPDAAEAYQAHRRSLGRDGLLVHLLEDDGAALSALRTRPELAQATTLRGTVEPERLRPSDFILGQLAQDADLASRARASLDSSRGIIQYEIGAHFDPRPETTVGTIEYLRAAR
jgi:hypothetical protein